MNTANVQYVSNEQGSLTDVLIPIELWQEILSELETSHLLKSETMKIRLLEARQREKGASLSQAIDQLNVSLAKETSLEDYFIVLAPNDIRLKGTRVGIETILYDFLHRERTPDDIAQAYPSLTLEQIYATLLFYFHNQQFADQYLADWLEWGEQQRKSQAENPSPVVEKLKKLRHQLEIENA